MREKTALENEIEARIQDIVDKILGKDQAAVVVNIETYLPEGKKEAVQQDSLDRQNPGFAGAKQAKEKEFLPGIPIVKKAKEETSGENKAVVKESVSLYIKNLRVQLIIHPNVPQESIEKVKKIILTSLGFSPDNQDIIIIEKMKMKSASILNKLPMATLITTIAIMLLAALFLFGPVQSFLQKYIHAIREKKDAELNLNMLKNPFDSSGKLVQAVAAPAEPGAAGDSKSGADRKPKVTRRFAIINDVNLPALLFLLQSESPEVIGILVNYLPEEIVSKLFLMLDREVQVKTILYLSETRCISSAEVDELEKRITEKINYVIGGDNYIYGVFDKFDEETRKGIITDMSHNLPDLATKIRKNIFCLEDMVFLDDRDVQLILHNLNTDILSIILKDMPEEFCNKVFKNMSERTVKVVKEEMEFNKKIPERRKQDLINSVVNLIKKLARENKITVKKWVRESPRKMEQIETTEESTSPVANT
jgi:hypothetical protein